MVDAITEEKILEILERGITGETLKEIDSIINMIPLTFDRIIKPLFLQNEYLYKRFIKSVIHLDENVENIEIEIKNIELPNTTYKEYKKVIDFNVYINKKIHLNIEMNRDYYENVKLRNNMYLDKIIGLSLVMGDNINKLEDIISYQLNLNEKEKDTIIGEDIIVPYSLVTRSIHFNNKKIFVRYLDYYRKLYYNKVNLKENELWLVMLTSKTFYELNEMLSKLIDDKLREKIVKDVIIMNMDYVIFSEYEQQRGEELIAYTREKNLKKHFEEKYEKEREEYLKVAEEETKKALEQGIERGIEEGIEQNKIEMIKNMLENKADYKFISKVSGKSIKEIKEIENN